MSCRRNDCKIVEWAGWTWKTCTSCRVSPPFSKYADMWSWTGRHSAANKSLQSSDMKKEQSEVTKGCYIYSDSHAIRNCPVYGQECWRWGKHNHFAKMCNSGKVTSRCKQMFILTETDEHLQDLFLNMLITEPPKNEWNVNLLINNQKTVSFKIDNVA